MLQLIKSTLVTSFALSTLAISFAHAQDASIEDLATRSRTHSCWARAIDRYYCPWFGGQFQGPYFDNGCSVKCAANQRAVCEEARCDENQNGQPVESHCECQ